MNIVMQLRKATNHPYLFPDADETGGFVTDERLINDSGKMVVLDKLLAKLRGDVAGKHKVLIFSQMTRMLDIMEDFLIFRGYEYCRIDGNTGGVDRDMQMAEFNNVSSSKFVFLLSTRAGGLGINLQAANHVVIYDSDWNPQMDLQAQDRAHRIGQTREVRVYRFVTDGTIEERVYQRALKKLYLDALIVQQGRAVAKKSDSNASREELLSMVRFGATEMFKSKGAEVTDADIDALLASGESRMAAMQKDVMKEQRQTLANFDYGVEEANLYDFEGVTFTDGQSRTIVVELPDPVPSEELTVQMSKFGEVQKLSLHPDMSKALVVFRALPGAVAAVESSGFKCHFSGKNLQQQVVTVDMIDEHWDGGGGRPKRERREVETFEEEVEKAAVAKKVAPPKLPRKPSFSWWWLADEDRIRELYNIECGNIIKNWRRGLENNRAGGAAKIIDTEDDDAAPAGAPAEPEDDKPLTAAQEKEKQQLWDAAFSSWSHREFRHFLSIITHGGVSRYDYARIAESMGASKTPQEVEAYTRAFWERGPSRIPRFDRIEAKIGKVTKRRELAREEADVCLAKVRTCGGDPRFSMSLPVKPLNNIHPDFDRRLYLEALQDDGSFSTGHLRAAVSRHPVHLLDAFVASRPQEFFERRATRLRTAVIAEAAKSTTGRTRNADTSGDAAPAGAA
jgi:SWI/SNF-related matrix-associated actin-dependent regulator of chromatin subfamily A member 5